MRIEGTGVIHGITADLRDISELAPVLTALAALADAPSEFTGIGHMRLHESDRLAVLASEIGALGGHVTELPDGLRMVPRPLQPDPDPFDSHDDHRMVMAAAVLGLAVPGLRVRERGHRRQDLPRVPQPVAADAGAGTLSPAASHSRLDEDDVRVRPGKGSRPRTRRRPAHEDAIDAFVTGVDRGRYRCWIGDRTDHRDEGQGTGPRRHCGWRPGEPHW